MIREKGACPLGVLQARSDSEALPVQVQKECRLIIKLKHFEHFKQLKFHKLKFYQLKQLKPLQALLKPRSGRYCPYQGGAQGEKLYIREVVWQNPAAQGDVLILAVNRRAVTRIASAANTPQYLFKNPVGWVDTFGIDRLDSGIVEIWFEE